MMTVFAQPFTATLPIDRTDALATLAKAERVDIFRDLLVIKQKDIDTLKARISVLNRIISEMSVTDEANKSIIMSYDRQIKEMEGIRKLYDLDVIVYKKKIKKLKRGKFWTALAGVAATVGALWLGASIN